MEAAGIVQPVLSRVEWAANTIFRPKPNGKIRTIHDFRPVNSATI